MNTVTSKRGAYLFFMSVVTVLVYLQVVRFSFLVFDDTPSILNNEAVRHWDSLPWFFDTDVWQGAYPTSMLYYRPLFLCWLLLNFKLFGIHGALWHAAEVVLYVTGVVLAWRLARKFTRDEFAALAAALIFALHPLHVESVAWISGAVDTLLSVFFFAGFLAYFRWRESLKREWLFACAALTACSLFTKEAGGALPVLIFLYELLVPAQTEECAPKGKSRLALAAALGAPIAIYAAARVYVLSNVVKAQDHRTLLDVVQLAPILLANYLKQIVWPAHLAAWYDIRLPHAGSNPSLILPLIIVVAFAGLTMWMLVKKRELGYFLLWWWVAIGPAIAGVLTLPEFDSGHDAYNFLAMFGICLFVAILLRQLPSPSAELFGFPAARAVILSGITAALALLRARQVNWWQSDMQMYQRAVDMSPRAIRPHALLGNEYLNHGKFDRAVQLYRETRDLEPDNWLVNYSYAAALYKTGRWDETFGAVKQPLPLNPRAISTYILWAQDLLVQGKKDEAIQVLEQGVKVVDNPEQLRERIQYISASKN